MKKYILNKVFKDYEESKKWADENLVVGNRQMYNGECILMVMYNDGISGEVVLTEIWTC